MATIEVHINNKVVAADQVLDEHAPLIGSAYFDHYHIDVLRHVGVNADVFITGIQSRMNDERFEVEDI